jgi:hypothetical protein
MTLNPTVGIRISDTLRGINKFKKFYQPRNKLVKDEKGNLLVEPHKILNS